MDENTQKKQPDPDVPEDQAPEGGSCMPYGAAPAKVKSYWYIVQPEDIGAFWRVPEKFNLPTQKAGGGWMWQELRNANFDWPGGFEKVNSACVLSGLFPGAKLHVPGDWPEPRPGVKTEPKSGVSSGNATAALIVGAVGIVGIGILAWVARRDRKGR